METLVNFLAHLTEPDFLAKYSQYLILIVFIFSFLEVVVPPIPGDTVLIISGSIGGIAGINSLWIILSSFTGTFIASILLYNLGYKVEHKILESPRFAWMIDTKVFAKIEKWFERYGYWTLLLSRLLPVARSGIVLAAGIVNFDKQKSLVAVAISILVSTTVFVLAGRYIGKQWSEIMILWHSHFRIVLIILAGLIILIGVITWVLKQAKKFKAKH